jgi:(1->4)-alpha-D-glucan 1-alpha-D-glucosylmutase
MPMDGPTRVPAATYRLQLNGGFTFAQAAGIVDYLDRLGISDVYASPIFKARPGSLHGYDVLDHSEVSEELGGEDGLRGLAAALHERGMGLVLDLVPNHMCIAGAENQRWSDVLENGPSSPSASFFDIDWAPPKEDLRDKVLLPILGDQYGRVLERGEIKVVREGGSFLGRYYEHVLPLAPKSWTVILEPVRDALAEERDSADPERVELESILTAMSHLPSRSERDPARVEERQREKDVIKRRLAALIEQSPAVREGVEASLLDLNGRPGDPGSFDRLEALLADQGYRLSHWRVASDEINYRRFFDINELAAMRVEDPEVFEALHALPLRLAAEGIVNGFRIDHVDGLFDPADYLRRLPDEPYVVVEKILVGDERLRTDWKVQGTTGYDFLSAVGGIFVDPASRTTLHDVYLRFAGDPGRWADVVYEGKKLVMEVSLSSELTVLARRLDRISEQHRYSRDFTLNSQQEALAEVIACFPVYRSYVRAATGEVGAEDRRHILGALRRARRRNPAMSGSLFDFLGSVILLEDLEGLDETQIAERRAFVMALQQLTGPVMAKGLEDTASYRFHPLAALNEVGCEPEVRFGPLEWFHAENAERRRSWPHSMTATSTHDTKRDEDVRARISVLSEIPQRWEQAIARWREMNRGHKRVVDEGDAPDGNEEYLLYQTLVGAWPPGERDHAPPDFVARIQGYMEKALREAKVHTSWVDPNVEYEGAVADFVAAVLDASPANPFPGDFLAFLASVLRPGLLNAVSQVVLKVAAPGVPDVYQGTELPEFRLVDPDNRRSVDYDLRRWLLGELEADAARDAPALAEKLLDDLDGRLKLWVTSRALGLRRSRIELFRQGEYVPLEAAGSRAREVVAFGRLLDGRAVIAVAARFFTQLPARPVGERAWEDTRLRWPGAGTGTWRDVITGRELRGSGDEIPLAEVLSHLPVALLERIRPPGATATAPLP